MHLPLSSSNLQAVCRSFHSPLSSSPQQYRQKKHLSHSAIMSFHLQNKIWLVFIITFYSNTNQCSCVWLQTCTETHIWSVSVILWLHIVSILALRVTTPLATWTLVRVSYPVLCRLLIVAYKRCFSKVHTHVIPKNVVTNHYSGTQEENAAKITNWWNLQLNATWAHFFS
jgi:hypothetical protein